MALLACLLLACVQPASAQMPAEQATAESLLVSFFPTSPLPGDWRSSDSLRIFRGEELYLLIDGGADIYLEYGFIRVGSQHFASSAEDEIDLEIYEMRDTQAAFGIFSFVAAGTGSEATYGQGGVTGEDFLIFWKDRFVVSITALSERSRFALPTFGRTVEGQIPQSGSRPVLTEALLQSDFRNEEVVLLKGTLSFERCAELGLGNLFRVREGASGRFDECRTFILRYQGSAECDSAENHALEILEQKGDYRKISGERTNTFLVSPKGTWIHVRQNGRYLLLALGENKEKVRRVAGKLDEAVVAHLLLE